MLIFIYHHLISIVNVLGYPSSHMLSHRHIKRSVSVCFKITSTYLSLF